MLKIATKFDLKTININFNSSQKLKILYPQYTTQLNFENTVLTFSNSTFEKKLFFFFLQIFNLYLSINHPVKEFF